MGPHFQRGLLLFDLRRFAEAEAAFGETVCYNPESAAAFAMLAASQCNQRKFTQGRETIEHALQLDPDSDYAHYIRAHALWGNGLLEQAESAISEAIRINPLEPSYFANRSAMAAAQEQYWQAKEWAEEGLAVDPEHVECLERLIESLFALELFEAAEQVVLDLLRIDPVRGEAHRRKGWLDFRKGELTSALEAFRFGASQQPEYGDGMQVFEKIARPDKHPVVAFLNRIAQVLHLRASLQFFLMFAPAAIYLIFLLKWPEENYGGLFMGKPNVAWLIVASWASLTVGVFAAAFILQMLMYDSMLSVLKPASEEPLSEQIKTWIVLGMGVVCILFLYLFVALSPLLMPRVGAAVLTCLSMLLGYRALRSYLIRVGYRLTPQSGLLRRFLLGVVKFDYRVLTAGSVLAGLVCAALWAAYEKKPEPLQRPKPAESMHFNIDLETGEYIDKAGKRHPTGEAIQRLFGVRKKQGEAKESKEKSRSNHSTETTH